MYSRRLKALQYKQFDSFSLDDQDSFRNLVLWLEDQKIRRYPIDDRTGLRDISSPNWEESFAKYLKDVSCPHHFQNKQMCLEFLLVTALKYEFQDDLYRYSQISASEVSKQINNPALIRSNPLDNLDFNSPEFIQGVHELAKILNVPLHPDHLITLEAVCILIKNRLSTDSLNKNTTKIENPNSETLFSIENSPLGCDSKDPAVDWAAKVLKILYINDLRDLQTSINHIIVTIQSITANPKTDSSLGKVGR